MPIVLTVVLFLVFGLALAWCLWRFTDFDAHTALLATAPGGIAQMGAFSAEVKANVPVVLSIHVLRITSVIVLMSGRTQAHGRKVMNPAGDHRSLAGIRVVDLSRALAGPYATMMLADVGADVLKVEPPAGDDSRGWLPFVETPDGAPEGAATESAYFLARQPRQAVGACSTSRIRRRATGCARCARQADVLVENYRPGVLARLGLDPARPARATTRAWSRCRSPASARAAPTASAPGIRPDRAGRRSG